MPVYENLELLNAPPSRASRVRARLMRSVAKIVRIWPAPPPELLSAMRILVIRPDHLGDMLFLGPAMRWLRQRLPTAHIALAMGPWARPALPACRETYDELIEIPFPAFERRKRRGMLGRWRLFSPWAQKLGAGRYDAALICRPDHWWGAALTRFAGIPLRLGFDTLETTPWLTTALPMRNEHAAASNLRLVASLTHDTLSLESNAHPLHFDLNARNLGYADALLYNIFGTHEPQPLAIIHPGSGAAIKLWDVAKWREIAMRLAQNGLRVLVTGGPNERNLTRDVASVAAGGVIDLGGETSFSLLAGLMARAQIVLGPDSGPLHLAVAMGASTVHLYGPSNPTTFGPWGDSSRHRIIRSNWECAPCDKFDWPDPQRHNCVRDIDVEAVWEVTQQLLQYI
jgi:heptosyltransferase-2/heptosyltransferase-3